MLQTEHDVEGMVHLGEDFGRMVWNRKTWRWRWWFCFLLFLPPPQLEKFPHYLCTFWCQYASSNFHLWVEWVDRSSWLICRFRDISLFTPIRKKPAKCWLQVPNYQYRMTFTLFKDTITSRALTMPRKWNLTFNLEYQKKIVLLNWEWGNIY